MVSSATNFSRSGLSDWIAQRASAVILLAYSLFLFGFLLTSPQLNYEAWSALFDNTAVKLFSLLAVLALCAHAWIGMWTIATDYLTAAHLGNAATFIRIAFQFGCALLVLVYLLWGIQIFWGI